MTEGPCYHVVIVDDDASFRRIVGKEVASFGHRTSTCGSVSELLELFKEEDPDVVLLDVRMPELNGIEGLKRLGQLGAKAEVIMLSGHGSVEDAVESMRAGAFHYLTKPFRRKELRSLLHQAGSKRRLVEREQTMIEYLKGVEQPIIVGESPKMQRAMEIARKVARSDVPVLVEGETGTGKELLARFVHHQSDVSDGPFVVVNCGALPESTLQSELFGHEKGSFTGAHHRRLGLLEIADDGTLFLDEIGEISPAIQVQLLRFLQFGELRRLGSNETLSVNVRLVAATNRRLVDEVEAGRFREDLLYRLNTIQVDLPPLRQRRDDIPVFVETFLERLARGGRPRKQMHPDALQALVERTWPGNVRELENMVTRLVLLSTGDEITVDDVEACFQGPTRTGTLELGEPIPLKDIERKHILLNLKRTDNDKPTVARQLGISLKTLYNRLHEYDVPL